MPKFRSSTFVFALAYVALVAGVFLALGGAAYAAGDDPSSASDQYGSKVENISVSGPSEPASTVSEVAQALPNTGLSLLATALVGGALVAVGIALRRRERHKADS
jgi:LPXTG-motif cell wall-anchored protein